MKPTTIAVIGSGYWGRNLVRNFGQLGALGWVCDAHLEVARAHAEMWEGARHTSSFDEILEDVETPAVAIASPARLHFEHAKAALESNKHVFVEKPLALNLSEGEKLVALAEEKNRVLMVGHILRYHPAVIKLRELIESDDLGEIRYIYSNRLNMGKIRTEENILWSFAPHDISVMLALLDEEPISVACSGGTWISQDVADVTLSQFTFPSGVRGHIHVSWLHPFKEQRFVVVGSKKMAVFNDGAEDKLQLYPHRVEWEGDHPSVVKAEAEAVAIESVEPLKAECQHFLDCIASGAQPTTDGREGLRVLSILDACERSMKQGGVPIA